MRSRLEWKVGVFVFIGLTLLAMLLIAFSKGLTFFQPTYTILLHAPNVGGLKTRATVLMSGVQIGTVSDITLAPNGRSVTISLKIYSKYVIHKDARFMIEQSGFLGDNYVAIVPTANAKGIYRNGDMAQAEAPFNLQEVARSASGFITRIDETAKRLNDSIADIRRLLLNEQTLTNLSVSAGNLRVVTERALGTLDKIDVVVATNSPAIASSGSNLVAFSEDMKAFAGALSGVMVTNGPALEKAVKNIESSTEMLKSAMEDIQAGKGPAGTLLKNEQMANDLRLISHNLTITSSNLNRLGLWGILWQHKPPKKPRGGSAEEPLVAPKNRPD